MDGLFVLLFLHFTLAALVAFYILPGVNVNDKRLWNWKNYGDRFRLKSSLSLCTQVALTENWAEMYKDKGIAFYSMHPGWSETPGLNKSLPGFAER